MAARPLDPAAAGHVWRQRRLADLAARAEAAGLGGHSGSHALLAAIREHTAALDALADAQADPGGPGAPWWADGEYSDARADAANDEGTRLLAARAPGPALAAFTEAARLAPVVAVYWANRAAAALAVGAAGVALESARRACDLEPGYAKARLRAGRALLALGRGSEAAAELGRAVGTGGRAGAAAARELARARALCDADREAAARLRAEGGRAALPDPFPPPPDAAARLHAADAALESDPGNAIYRIARVEGLILVGRAADAAAFAAGLPRSPDADYVLAEALWRSGRPGEAAAVLDRVKEGHAKHRALVARVGKLAAAAAACAAALDTGDHEAATAAADAGLGLLQGPQPASLTAPGMAAFLYTQRGEAALLRDDPASAAADAVSALDACPGSPPALWLSGQALGRLPGRQDDAFLALRQLAMVDGAWAGLGRALAAAAAACGRVQAGPSSGGPQPATASPAARDAYAVLGLPPGAGRAEVRAAYLAGAAATHPDKCAAPGAAAAFVRLRAAYDALASV